MCFHKPRRIPSHLLLVPEQPVYRRPMSRWRQALALLLLSLTLAGISVARAEEGSGQLLLQREGGTTTALHLRSSADVTIKGMLAKVVLTQTFQNSGPDWAEAVYVFPLPETAAVSRMVMTIGERKLVAEIRERQEAQRIYQEAKAAGKRAALTNQQRPNLFTQAVANIGPGEMVTIELQFQDLVDYRDGVFRWRLPTTLTPRYIPGTPSDDPEMHSDLGNGWSLPTDQVPDAHLITPWMAVAADGIDNPLSVHVTLDTGLSLADISSPYHQLVTVAKNADKGVYHDIVTQPAQVPMDRDFELSWRTPGGQAPNAALFVEQVAGEDYALLMVVPPQQALTQTLPREVIFIIDTSGSMGGTSIEQAKSSLQMALGRLNSGDRFNLIEFNSYHRALFAQSQPASASNLQRAQNFVAKLRANGGTEMEAPLRAALEAPETEGYLKQVVFITDGSVGNEAALFELIHRKLGDARLFTVGIGSAPNSFFMRKAAEFGRGTFTFIGAQHEVAERMQALFNKLESPVLTDIAIAWPNGITPEIWPERIPDLYQGEPLLLSARFNAPLPVPGEIVIRGQQAGQTWSRTLNVRQENSGIPAAGVSVRWARSKIEALLDSRVRGRAETEVRDEVLPLALTHQLLSPYTSFVAAEETPARPEHEPLATQPVPNLLPHGQSAAQQVMYPRTATSAPLQWLLGWLMLSLWLATHWRTWFRRHG